MVTEKAYAKINLYLDISGKREDGYHDVVSVMQTVDWYDLIEMEINVSGETNVEVNSAFVPAGNDNIAYRAAKIFLEAADAKVGFSIKLKKNIPVAAGMAGGSADAAAVLRAANRLLDFPLSTEHLLTLAAKVGADVPFCLLGGTRIARGIGEKLEEVQDCPDCFIVCAKLGDGVSTPEAYRVLDEKYNEFITYRWHREKLELLLDGLTTQQVVRVCDGMYNVFEESVPAMRPDVERLKRIFSEHGGVAMMSGSGPSVFAVFQNSIMAEKACTKARLLGAEARVCRPLTAL